MAALLAAASAFAQQPKQYTTEDYARAELFMSYNLLPLAAKGMVRPHWLHDGRFWFRDTADDGWDYVIVNPSQRTKTPAFDHTKLTAALKAADDQLKDDARHLHISDLEFSETNSHLLLTAGHRQFSCQLAATVDCKRPLPKPQSRFLPIKKPQPSYATGTFGFVTSQRAVKFNSQLTA